MVILESGPMFQGNVYIPLPPGEKGPRGKGWQEKTISWQEVERRRTNNPRIGIGLLLGPKSGVIDVEGDGPEAEASRRALFGGQPPETCRWRSSRGEHHLYRWDDRFADLGAYFKQPDEYPGLEFRIGAEAAQSVIPPTGNREWIVSPDQSEPAALPEDVITRIVSIAPKSGTFDCEPNPDPDLASVERELQRAKVDRLVSYFGRHDVPIKNIRTDHHGRVFIHLGRCPFKPASHTDGDPCVIVNPDGSHGWACRHGKCADLHWSDVEEIYGPLSSVIKVDADLGRMVAETIHALGDAPNVYQHGVLVEVTRDAPRPKLCLHDNGAPQLRQIRPASLAVVAASVARFEQYNQRKKRGVRCLPPDAVIRAVDSASNLPGIPVITGIVSGPVLRADGSILCEPGYDKLTGLYLDTDGTYPALMNPRDALDLLHGIVSDFPFTTSAHRSGWLASLFTMLTRAAFTGPSPLFLFEANASRVGKGLLTDTNSMIVEGRKAARYSPPGSNEETRKLITSIAMSGVPYILFDNVKNKLGGEALENAMTAGRWSDRILGANRHVDLPLNLTWLATANNATLTVDMIGRTCHVQMSTNLERPDLRSGFRHADLLAHVREHRRELVIAALSIPAAYVRAGRPDQHIPAWGGFEAWSDLVRGCLVWAGEPDPGETRAGLAEAADDETEMHRRLMEGWEQLGFAASVATVFDLFENGDPQTFPILREVIHGLPGVNKRDALGKLLRQFKNRVIGDRCFRYAGSKWEVVKV
ncbi:MAG: bifunctional DNA primase/polymerase [Planctomycetaceae bacterium]